MSEIIRELFRGNLSGLEGPFEASSRENTAFSEMEILCEKMEKEFPVEYHTLVEQYKASVMELLDAACEEEYLRGYQFGVRMMVAAWPNRKAGNALSN